MISSEDMRLLAMLIEDEVKKEFNFTHLSGNLKDTIKIEKGSTGGYNIIISAKLYDIAKYKEEGVKIYRPGSYASEVDKTGGFSGTHKEYVNKCINKAIDRWLKSVSGKYKMIRRS